ncbi:hypothetical protein HMPREF0322_01625 [Desulfitobacterium hafniense DP7]|uniref:Tat pathway signal sequence domain protein n=1 Tax=Desulfitobacterium hafniense DP7 TaxID=537010 RepID=G9XL14_DESHA|nr:hypothetical protein [Desulfitobacterium hafniense]EHL07731.1 hypothetical protein HMPREF0322_01625 [Desulfitobacterium hafniense DP7]
MKRRGLTAVLLAFFLVGSLPIAVSASEGSSWAQASNGGIIQPYWTYLQKYFNDFYIEPNGKALVEVIASARNSDEIRIEADLQQYAGGNWTSVKKWLKTSVGASCGLSETWYVLSGYSYRMVSSVKVYKNGVMVEQGSYVSPTRLY